MTGLTTYEPYGTPEHGRHHHRRDFQPNPINAVVVRKWNNRDYGPGGKTVFLTNASVEQLLRPFEDDDERSLIENCCIKESKQQWSVKHPPQKTARAVRVHVMFILLMFALATAYRLPCEHEATGGSQSAGSVGDASSASRPGTTLLSLRKTATASFIWRSTRYCSGSSSRMCHQASVCARKFLQNIGSQRMTDLISEFQHAINFLLT
jgi:hypothetical protein